VANVVGILDVEKNTEFDVDELNPVNNDAYSIWDDYEVHCTYDKNPHRYCMGTTDTTTSQPTNAATVAFVQLSHPTLIWIADWTAARYNSKPFIPSADIGGSEWILLDERIDPGMITLDADGITPLYRISGTYVFGHTHPAAKLAKNVDFAIPPWVDADKFNRAVTDDMFQTDIISRKYPPPKSPPPQ
jgi:hypothetical protein